MNGLFSQNGLGGFVQGSGLGALFGGQPDYYGQQQQHYMAAAQYRSQQQGFNQQHLSPIQQMFGMPSGHGFNIQSQTKTQKHVESHELTPWEIGCKQIDDAVQAVEDSAKL